MRVFHTRTYVLVLLAACDATKIGTPCNTTSNCNLKDQLCAGGICTRSCRGQYGDVGCPVGYNCAIVDEALGLTCNKVPFAVDDRDAMLLFGKSCATDPDACYNTGDPNPSPTCRRGAMPVKLDKPLDPLRSLENDPLAYCTGGCETDKDCPFTMICATDYDHQKRCLLRERCSACAYNDNCPLHAPACVPARDGISNYCTSICNSDSDCPGALQTAYYLTCQPGQDTNGNIGRFCFHKFGSCVGQGNVCDPCRKNEDCTAADTFCHYEGTTGERFCTKTCAAHSACTSPNMTSCGIGFQFKDDFGQPVVLFFCTGAGNVQPVFSCWP